MFAKYDYQKNEVNFTGDGEFLLVWNEIKNYRDRETDADFAMRKADYSAYVYNAVGDTLDSQKVNAMVPRLMRTYVGDIMTTNTIKEAAGSLSVGDKLYIGADGYLTKTQASDNITWVVVKVYTMPDGQPGVKIQRIA